jgi:hypothetical protein
MSAASVTSTFSTGQPLDVHAEDRLRLLARGLGRRAVLHAARLAAAADVDLGLHHHGLADAPGDLLRRIGRGRHLAGGIGTP